jgi:hypothetical protein
MVATPIACIVLAMDEGLPIAYQLLDDGVPVLASDGTPVGTVMGVLAAPEEDVFHGLLITTSNHGVRFVEAGLIASIHERGCDLRIDAVAAGGLPEPEHKAPVYSEDPDKQQRWRHWVHHITGRSDWNRER